MPSKTLYASIIIDDPLLWEEYGYLNYKHLLYLMDRYNFCTSIAFIPWNYNRTEKKIASLFRERPDRFSLCVHGCDHTRSEFAKKDSIYLDTIIKLATARMIEHEKRTGIPFDRIMVFPQGVFSNEALSSLFNNNYLAVINTESKPVNGALELPLPFFLRYRPDEVSNLKVNPLIIVLHHNFFKGGYDKLVDLVQSINSKPKIVVWDSVGNIVRSLISPKVISPTFDETDLSGLTVHGYYNYLKIYIRRYMSEFKNNIFCPIYFKNLLRQLLFAKRFFL